MPNWAKESEVKAGTVLIADGGFTCIKEGAELTVQESESGLYVLCSGPEDADCNGHDQEHHYLDGQLDDGEVYIGLSLKRAA